jgi:hypothetical protein
MVHELARESVTGHVIAPDPVLLPHSAMAMSVELATGVKLAVVMVVSAEPDGVWTDVGPLASSVMVMTHP